MLERDRIEEALATLGALLEERGEAIGVLIVGGSSLLLLGLVERPTADVDVVGFSSAAGYARADVLPEFLAIAVRETHDPSPAFLGELSRILHLLGLEVPDGGL